MTSTSDVAVYGKSINISKRSNKLKDINKVKSFSELSELIASEISESPVGMRGRTTEKDANDYISSSGIEQEFFKIVKKLGGKTVAKVLLDKMSSSKQEDSEISEAVIPEKYLRDSGFKIKKEYPIRNGKELEFYDKKVAKEAFEDLKSAGYMDKYTLDLANTFLTYKTK